MSCPITNAIFGLVGAFGGGLFGHWLAGIRDRAGRKRAFQGFLSRWHAEISAPDRSPTIATLKPDPAIIAYDSKLPSFCAEIERVRDVFKDTKRFAILTSRLASLQAEDWQQKNPRDVISEAINELIRFVT